MVIAFDQIPLLTTNESWGVVFVCICMCMDMIVGTVCAFAKNKWTSTKFREGIYHKCQLFLCMVLAIIAQTATALVGDLGFSVPLVLPVCVAIIVMEIGSCIENIVAANPALAESTIAKLFSSKHGKAE